MEIYKQSLPKKSARRYCDELWSIVVKLRDKKLCAICGLKNVNGDPKKSRTKRLNSHHLISRKAFKYRWDIDNGITLCANCHEWNLDISPHTAPWNFEKWMKKNRPSQYDIWVKNRDNKDRSMDKTYEEIYFGLEEMHKELTGAYFRYELSRRYKLYGSQDIVIEKYKSGYTLKEIGELYSVTRACISGILKRHNIELRKKKITKAEKDAKKELFRKKLGKKILQYDFEGNFIREYKSIVDASEETNIGQGCIGNSISGRSKSAGCYVWIPVIGFSKEKIEGKILEAKQAKDNQDRGVAKRC